MSTETTENRKLQRMRRLSETAMKKLEPPILRIGAEALRNQVLAKTFNDLDLEASGALNMIREIAIALGTAYQKEQILDFDLESWYQACGLTRAGELP